MSDIFAYNVKELITNYGRKKYKPWGQKELDYYHGVGATGNGIMHCLNLTCISMIS